MMKPKQMIRSCKLVAAVFAAALLLASCNNSSLSDEEIKNTAKELITASEQINEIFFGAGLPVDETTSVIKGEDTDTTYGNYCTVTDDCAYRTVDDIKTAAEKVFSDDYLSLVYENAFEGTDSTVARYGTNSAGVLTRNIFAEGKQTDSWTAWDYDSIKIKNANNSIVVFEIEGTFDGKTDKEVMEMINTADGWRLNSATY